MSSGPSIEISGAEVAKASERTGTRKTSTSVGDCAAVAMALLCGPRLTDSVTAGVVVVSAVGVGQGIERAIVGAAVLRTTDPTGTRSVRESVGACSEVVTPIGVGQPREICAVGAGSVVTMAVGVGQFSTPPVDSVGAWLVSMTPVGAGQAMDACIVGVGSPVVIPVGVGQNSDVERTSVGAGSPVVIPIGVGQFRTMF